MVLRVGVTAVAVRAMVVMVTAALEAVAMVEAAMATVEQAEAEMARVAAALEEGELVAAVQVVASAAGAAPAANVRGSQVGGMAVADRVTMALLAVAVATMVDREALLPLTSLSRVQAGSLYSKLEPK